MEEERLLKKNFEASMGFSKCFDEKSNKESRFLDMKKIAKKL